MHGCGQALPEYAVAVVPKARAEDPACSATASLRVVHSVAVTAASEGRRPAVWMTAFAAEEDSTAPDFAVEDMSVLHSKGKGGEPSEKIGAIPSFS